MTYTDQALRHAGSAEVLVNGMFGEVPGVLARTLPVELLLNSNLGALSTTGAVAVRAIPLPASLVVSQIEILLGATAAVGPTHFWLALLDLQLNVLAVSADQGAAAQAASTPIKLAMGTAYVIPQTGRYYIAASSAASTTAPTLAGTVGVAGAAIGALGNPVPFGTAGNQITPPAVGSQLNGGAISVSNGANFGAWIF